MEQNFTAEAKNLINKHSVISFDLFDTLLARPYARPSDLFVHLEKLENNEGFAARRKNAEKAARLNCPAGQDIRTEEIYALLPSADAHMMAKEIALEETVLLPNPEIIKIFNYAKEKNKKIIILSDMYLSADILSGVLAKRGISGYHKLYVSGQERKMKHSCTMYKHVLEKENAAPSEVLHIGDNMRVDVDNARSCGISALYYNPPVRRFLEKHARENKFLNKTKYNFNASVVMAVIALKEAFGGEKDYFEKLGYHLGGPAAYGFARFIAKTAVKERISDLFFIARDGFALREIFASFNIRSVNAEYVYAPRIFKTNGGENFCSYIKACFKNGVKAGVIDSASFYFSAQTLIENCLGKGKVRGIYWAAAENAAFNYDTFLPRAASPSAADSFTKCWGLMELLFGAPEPPVAGVDAQGRPVYKENINEFETTNIKAQEDITKGVLGFARDINDFFGGRDIFLEGRFLTELVNNFICNPSAGDKESLKEIFFASDAAHKKYDPLFVYSPCGKDGIKDYLRRSFNVLWKTPFQRFVSVLIYIPVMLKRAFAQK